MRPVALYPILATKVVVATNRNSITLENHISVYQLLVQKQSNLISLLNCKMESLKPNVIIYISLLLVRRWCILSIDTLRIPQSPLWIILLLERNKFLINRIVIVILRRLVKLRVNIAHITLESRIPHNRRAHIMHEFDAGSLEGWFVVDLLDVKLHGEEVVAEGVAGEIAVPAVLDVGLGTTVQVDDEEPGVLGGGLVIVDVGEEGSESCLGDLFFDEEGGGELWMMGEKEQLV